MGLIKAGAGALGGTLADQWKEFFYCEAMEKDIMVTKGRKRTSSRSSNTKGNDNIISNGSVVAVADGQCMMIVEQGKVVEVCAEPGEFRYDASTEPSIFTGSLGGSIRETFRTVGRRFTFGGDTGKDQRVYYFNTKELVDNKFGTPNPVPFRVVDSKIGLDVDVSVRCSGVYSYKITDPLLFYTNVCGNVEQDYTRGELDSQLGSLRGLQVVSIALGSVTLPEEDAEMIKQLQRTAVLQNPNMAGAALAGAQADAMKAAASNSAGAMAGFMGMGMAMNAGGGMNAQHLFAMGQQSAEQRPVQQTPGAWRCSCGASATGKFCPECGSARPVDGGGWTCSCGAVNKGRFCPECGARKTQGALLYRCDKCGWEPEDPANPPKFCPECGDPFDENDRRPITPPQETGY